MNFIIHFNIIDFVKAIPAESIVYSVAFTETLGGEAEALITLTSDAGLAGGTIHALRFSIEANGADESTALGGAFDKVSDLLILKRITRRQGLMLTEGLNEALRFYSKTLRYSVQQLDQLLKREKTNE